MVWFLSSFSSLILQITWWNGTRELTDTQKWRIAHENGTGAAKSRVALTLSRADLGRKLVCEVNSSAMTVPAKTSVVINMTLAPDKLVMISPKVGHTELD